MSDSWSLRRIGLLAVVSLALTACDPSPEPRSTLPSGDGAANPGDEGPTPQTLAGHVEEMARTRASRPYEDPAGELPAALAGLDYDGYRSIRFRPDSAIWRGVGAFEVQLLHPGFLFDVPVRIHLVSSDGARDVPFDPALFTYEGTAAGLAGGPTVAASGSAGYSGFRVHFPLNDPDRMDEVVVFQGASYFRLVGPEQVYGLSSRGLAIDVARDSGEEFPDFTDFWIVRPQADATSLVFHALLDSPSLTGAYRFELEPATNTVLHVDATLFARRDVAKLGIAPLSSMYLYGPNLASRFDDFRPRVHDSEGLMMETGNGEWIWRPLSNQRGLRVTSLRDVDPSGFGLIQRERAFDAYLDLEARYHQRPSAWVETEGAWGGGGVELLEIPTESEFNDNIATYWVPDEPLLEGQERRYRYTVSTFDARLDAQHLGAVARTRIGWDALPGESDPPPRSRRRFVLDFRGGALDGLPDDAEVVVVASVSSGRLEDIETAVLPDGGGRRLSFRLVPESGRPADMRIFLTHDGTPVTETWSYVWYAEQLGGGAG